MKNNAAISYKTLRDYVKNVLDINATVLDGDVAETIGMSDKSIQNVYASKRDFRWSEAKKIALYFMDKCKGFKGDYTILRQLLYNFLLSYGSIDADAEVNETVVNVFLKEQMGIEISASSEIPTQEYFYSNLPELRYAGKIMRDYLYDDIKKSIASHKIIFLSGFSGTGKSFVANVLANEYLQDEGMGYSVAIWNNCRFGDMSFNAFIINILLAFEYETTGNLTLEEKKSVAIKFLSDSRTIIVMDGLESIQDNGEKQKILSFLSEQISQNTLVFITSNERLSTYREVIGFLSKFKEIPVERFSVKEWEQISQRMGESRTDIGEAKKLIPEIDKYVYDLCKGNLYLMIHMLSAVSEKVLNGFDFYKIQKEYKLSDIDNKSYDNILKKSILGLSQNNMRILIALSLFVVPVTLKELSFIANLQGVDEEGCLIEESPLAISILQCHNLYLVDRCISNGVMKFSLAFMVRPVIQGNVEGNESIQEEIIERWIQYYLLFSENIGFCFDDFKRLEILDCDSNAREFENIKAVLSYCENNKRWQEFYTISENTKYFFYTRGISEEGEKSIHYRRALAARHLQDYEREYNALVYHCNVSCKSHSWSNIEACFDRIDEIECHITNIASLNRYKYEYIKALYFYAKGDYELALSWFCKYEKNIVELLQDGGEQENKLLIHDYVASLRWHGECLLMLGQSNRQNDYIEIEEEIQNILATAIYYADKVNFERAIVHSNLIRVKACLILKNDCIEARKLMEKLKVYTSTIENDAHYNEEFKKLSERLNTG